MRDQAPSAGCTEEVLALVAAEPREGWPRLLRRTESKLRILMHFRMLPELRARFEEEDLLQEVWLEASRTLDRFEYRGPGSLQRWLAGILRNKLSRAARTLRRLPVSESALHASAGAGANSHPGLLDALARSQPGVSRDARRQEAEQRVRSLLCGLPQAQREAILLRIYEGLSGREAAQRLGIDPSTFSSRFHKALDSLSFHLRAHL